MGMSRRLLRVKELEAITGIEAWRWYELFAAGEGPDHIRVGKTIRVRDDALDRWITEQEQATKDIGA